MRCKNTDIDALLHKQKLYIINTNLNIQNGLCCCSWTSDLETDNSYWW